MRLKLAAAISIPVLSGSLWLRAQVKDFHPVTEAMLRYFINKALGQEFFWAAPALATSSKQPQKLRIERALADGGWLQIALAKEGKR